MKYHTGNKDDYYWIEFASSDFDLTTFVQKLSDLLIDKYLGIVCFDGGIFIPSKTELNRGWYKKGEISYSPIINQNELNEPIYESYDQWCLFKNKTEFDEMTDFVNYGAFTLKNRETELTEADPTWDFGSLRQSINSNKELQDKFWNETKIISPDNIIINGDFFIFCAKNENEIEKIKTVANKAYN